jgi:hypothetical protein
MHSQHYTQDYKDIFLALGILVAALLALGATTAFADTNDQDWENRDEARSIDVQLSGSREVPPVNTDTTGRYWISFDEDGSDMTNRLDVYEGDEITAAHLHCAEPGENGPPFVTIFEDSNGTDVDGQLVSSSIDNNDIDDANCQSEIGYDIDDLQDLARAINDGKVYVNVHSQSRPEGLVRADLPEGQRNDDEEDNDSDHWNDGHGWKDDDHDGKSDWYKDRDGNWKDSCNDWSDDNQDGKHDWNNKEWSRWNQDHGNKNEGDRKDDHDSHGKDSDRRDWNTHENDGRDGRDGKDGKDGNSWNQNNDRWKNDDSDWKNHSEDRDDRNRDENRNEWKKADARDSRSFSNLSARLGLRIGH